MLCATALIAFFLPRRPAKRLYWLARYVSLVQLAACAASRSAARSHTSPLPVLPLLRLPALSLLPGQMPAQDARCAADGKWVRSVPISARKTSRSEERRVGKSV